MALILNVLFKSLKAACLKCLTQVDDPEQKWILGSKSMMQFLLFLLAFSPFSNRATQVNWISTYASPDTIQHLIKW